VNDRVLVRCENKTVFPVDARTLEPLSCGWYDPWCFSQPEPNVKYIEHSKWTQRERNPHG
jgi:hypothetical protein